MIKKGSFYENVGHYYIHRSAESTRYPDFIGKLVRFIFQSPHDKGYLYPKDKSESLGDLLFTANDLQNINAIRF
jgi:hypothetical protein